MSRPDAVKAHARYSLVERRIWNDWRGLSAPHPSGRHLWLYLLTTPFLGVLPGLIVAGEAQMAEHIGWPLKGFRRAFIEILDRRMALVDWKARVVVLPKVLLRAMSATDGRHVESPNVVRGWRQQWTEVPECALKADYWLAVRDLARVLGSGFVRAFDETVQRPAAGPSAVHPFHTQVTDPGTNPSSTNDAKPSAEGSAIQEQDQEQDLKPPSGEVSRSDPTRPPARGEGGRHDQDPAAAILGAMRAATTLRGLATEALAGRFAAHARQGGHMGRLDLADVLHAIRRVDDDEQTRRASSVGPRPPEQLVAFLQAAIKRTVRGEAQRAVEHESGQVDKSTGNESWRLRSGAPLPKPLWEREGVVAPTDAKS